MRSEEELFFSTLGWIGGVKKVYCKRELSSHFFSNQDKELVDCLIPTSQENLRKNVIGYISFYYFFCFSQFETEVENGIDGFG